MVKFVVLVLSQLGKLNFTLLHARQPGMRAFSLVDEEELMEEYRTAREFPILLARRLRMHMRAPTRSQQMARLRSMPPAAIKRRHRCNRVIAR